MTPQPSPASEAVHGYALDKSEAQGRSALIAVGVCAVVGVVALAWWGLDRVRRRWS